ncbi:MAG: 4-phosphopantoate--beta-alanine ligase [Methanonatronarchaeales archaeon]|nr:4-phosphopantoate--beta-alanine ligase [Methanonatronarchaeales archaeon]
MIPGDHPRAESLARRELLVRGWREGIVSTQGLVAHGRGETFDYLLGEESTPPAQEAEMAAAAALLLGDPVVSVNGNAAALAPGELVELSGTFGAPLEVNLFHRSEERIERIADHLRENGAREVLGLDGDAEIPGLSHGRGIVDGEGIYSADTVLVPLEDGDRTRALVDMGKTVLAIDLNPMSRTSVAASVAVVDELTRAVPKVTNHGKGMKRREARRVLGEFDSAENRAEVLRHMRRRLGELAD